MHPVLRATSLLAALMVTRAAFSQPELELAGLVNDYRNSAQSCEGSRMPMAGALTPSDALAQVRATPGGDLSQALRKAGYQAVRSAVLSVSGASRPEAVMNLLRERYCRALLDPRFSEIGVAREGTSWQLVLAQPLIAPDLGDWREAGRAVLERVNAARGAARTCGGERFEAAPSLVWNDQLAQASLAHSRDMAQHDYFSHEGRDDSTAAERASRHGYRWASIGENIAAGQGSPEKVVAGWLASPGHCANIMNPQFKEMGAAFATNPDSDMTIYWTQVFGTAQGK